ncbi:MULTISPECIES: 2,5-diamino-6-(ribosylamino)-4(3H)-pyrimidinone 5'-phosphate reductase [unclassified Haladaptatus]|uniref:2,5-diamino-6-(ribosylamino)-4(3H)-pyrimidinone 5'-phosphate reductase n=1 Tax=unclassified Haladaptatus TaxID=2622732 RepID=UPI0023E7D310|nr:MULTISPECIES: 2,5-diamino-6-(ribosylamino)-4(3H)-pyrimidinone 5'-phosphate reductase [unclassified Haladaptatus]
MRVVVNAAMSVDGKLSHRRRKQVVISGDDDFDRMDAIRAENDAVMVGAGTVVADDPSLTVDDPDRRAAREARGVPENPARIVADSHARCPRESQVFDDRAHTYLLVTESAHPVRIRKLEREGVTVIVAGEDRVNLTAAFDALADHGIESIMVEGGGELIFSLFEEGLVDELTVFVGSLIIGGREAPTLADGEGFVAGFPRLELTDVQRMDDGVVLSYVPETTQ